MIADHRIGNKTFLCLVLQVLTMATLLGLFYLIFFVLSPADVPARMGLQESSEQIPGQCIEEMGDGRMDGCFLFIGWLVCLLLAGFQPFIVERTAIKVVKAVNKMFGWWWQCHADVSG